MVQLTAFLKDALSGSYLSFIYVSEMVSDTDSLQKVISSIAWKE